MGTALVTGACKNTGVAIVEKFAGEGWDIVFTGREPTEVRAAEQRYRTKFPKVNILGYPLHSLTPENTVDEAAAEQMFAYLDARKIFVDTLILNAADQGLGMRALESPLSDFLRVIQTNMVWDYELSVLAAARMKEQGGGSIINTSSMVSIYGQPAGVGYPTSKFAVNGMTKSLARELAKDNIRVNAVAPGVTKTDMVAALPEQVVAGISAQIPLGRVGEPQDVANAFLYLASDLASYVTGEILSVDGCARA